MGVINSLECVSTGKGWMFHTVRTKVLFFLHFFTSQIAASLEMPIFKKKNTLFFNAFKDFN